MNEPIKTKFEDLTRYYLPKTGYTIIRLDGKAFHSFTKRFKRPFDDNFINLMNETTRQLCAEISGVKMAYVQSDEISLIISEPKENTQLWFDGNIQKIASVSSSIATAHFNKYLIHYLILESDRSDKEKLLDLSAYSADCLKNSYAYFDSRVFSVPQLTDVFDYLILRQKDAVKNSVSMVAQSLYSHKVLDGKKTQEKIEMSKLKGIDWTTLPAGQQRGRVLIKRQVNKVGKNPSTGKDEISIRHEWRVEDSPIFKKDVEYIKAIFS
jgi:tRNA(His) guanylyltransferase